MNRKGKMTAMEWVLWVLVVAAGILLIIGLTKTFLF